MTVTRVRGSEFLDNTAGQGYQIDQIRILVVERNCLVRKAIQQIVNDLPCVGMSIGVEISSKLFKLIKRLAPHVILLDVSTSLKESLKVIRFVRKYHPHIGMVALMAEASPEISHLLVKSGVHSILDEGATEHDLEIAIRASATGHAFRSRHVDEQVVAGAEKIETLTASEVQVLLQVMHGRTNQAIASELHVTIKTVEAHLTRIYRKLQVNSRAQAIIRAQKLYSLGQSGGIRL